MVQRHFDVIILGDGLAARIAGVLLARGGCRVLTLQEGHPTSPAWFLSCLHLERLLDLLGGRSCLAPPIPFQVITGESRLDLNSGPSLEEELRREFPSAAGATLSLLGNLQALGEGLEEALWRTGLPLSGYGGKLRFALRRIASFGALRAGAPLLGLLDRLPLGEPRDVLAALFAGLALSPAEELTTGEAALLWASAVRLRGVSPSGLDALLRHRYEQFHGEGEDLAALKELTAEKRRLAGISLKNGGHCSASYFLIGSDAVRGLLPSGLLQPSPGRQGMGRYITTDLQGRLSPLLARRVILGDGPPLRLSFGSRGSEVLGAIDLPAPVPERDVHQRLSRLIPFADFALTPSEGPLPRPEVTAAPLRHGILGPPLPSRAGRNALLCHGASLLPTLGSTGEVLTGVAAGNRLLRLLGK